MGVSNLFTSEDKERVKIAIEKAELNTSGEIRVHIESTCSIDVLDRAAEVFSQLNMHKTELRNGVLFYLSINDRKFAILGDAGINAKTPDNFWEDIKTAMLNQFKDNNIIVGLEIGIDMAGQQLKSHFAHQSDDINELSDEVSFGK